MANEFIGMDPVQNLNNQWTVQIDGNEITNLEARKANELQDEEWDNIRDTAADILSRCPSPQSTGESRTGLALGKVQSGKTLSYTALIALAVDNGYRITLVLAGTKNPLLEQNYNRLCTDLEAISSPRLTAFKNIMPSDAGVIQGVIAGQGHAMIVCLKNRGRIDSLRRTLSIPELNRYPTLIIDDEGDEASLNTQFRRGRRSPIYHSIVQLRESLQCHAYIAYTATPQANLLLAGIDVLSPDFGTLIQPGRGYCGGSIFFGHNRNQYIRIVPIIETENSTEITDGLKRAIALFLVGAAIRHLREPIAWHSMLIHTSNLRNEHQLLRTNIENLVERWRAILELNNTDPARQELDNILREAYADISTTVTSPPAWDDVSNQLRNEIWIEVWMVNSLPLGRDPVGTPFRLRNNILVGGNMLGRGVTLPGLAVTYITRRAQNETNADTMEQRARWFGYKQSYLDLCRIFLTEQLSQDYTELLRHEDDFWDSLTRSQRQGLAIRDWPRMFRLDMSIGIRPTRQNVANYRQFRSRGWEIQRHPVEQADIASKNIQLIMRFLDQHQLINRLYGHVLHQVISGCPMESVIKDLISQLQTDGTDWEGAYQTEYLSRLLMGGRLQNIDVVRMAGEENGFRKRTKNGAINPMQGHDTHREATDPEYYPGDEYIHGGQPQLQVHLIKLEVSGMMAIHTHSLALFIPSDNPRYDLRFVVREERNEPIWTI